MMSKEANAKNKKKKSVLTDLKRFFKVINFLMPYILSVSFVVLLFSLLGIIGTLGDIISAPFLGLFSIAGSAYFAIMLLYHAVVWKYDRKHKICLRRVICTFIATISVSILQHLLQYKAFHTGDPIELFNQALNGDGGGLVGGILAYFLAEAVTVYGAAAIMLVVMLFMLLQLFNISFYPFAFSEIRIQHIVTMQDHIFDTDHLIKVDPTVQRFQCGGIRADFNAQIQVPL